VSAESGAAAAYAAAQKFRVAERNETTVILITGSGLKDISGVLNRMTQKAA
jgi:threonine synthase